MKTQRLLIILGLAFAGCGATALGTVVAWFLVGKEPAIRVGDEVMLVDSGKRIATVCRDNRWLGFIAEHPWGSGTEFPKNEIMGGPFFVASGVKARVSEVHPNGYRVYIDRFDDRGQDVYVEAIFVTRIQR